MMSEYEKQAAEFCSKWGIEIKWLFIGAEVNTEWGDNKKRNHWAWVLTKNGNSTCGEFWDSIVNTHKTYQDPNKKNNPKKPTEYDLLSCLEKYGYNSFKDFCFSFEFDGDSRKAYKIYEAVKKEYSGLVSVLGNNKELWKELREIC